jgi:hypothetical protein
MPGACCTRGLVCKVRRRSAHEHTGTDGAIRHSLRNGFTAYAVLSPATNSSCHRRQRISGRSSSVELISPPHNLAPATGVGTTRFCRTQQHRSSCALSFTHGKPPCEHRLRATLPRPPQPVPTFVTMANAPLSGTGWRDCTFDLPDETGQEPQALRVDVGFCL